MPMRRGPQAARQAVPLEGWLPPGPSDVMALRAVLEKDPSGSLITEVLDAMVADRLSDASLRLLPILHPLLVRREVHHPAVARIAGFYRQTRGRNLVLAHTAAEVMGALDERGQVGVCSRGLASALAYYPDLGMRPTVDINVTASAGVDLGELQRTLTTRGGLQLTSKFISRRSLVLRDARGFNIAIRSVVDESTRVTLPDDVLLRDSVSVAVGADQLAVLSPEYLFCDVIHRGLRYRSPVSARWVADAVMAVRSAQSFDWRRVQEYADLFGVSATLQTGINWLATEGFLTQYNLVSRESGLDRKVQEIRVAPPSASIRRRAIDRSIVLPNRFASGDLRNAIRARAGRLASVREAKPGRVVAASGGGGARPLDSWPPPQDERARLLTQLAQGRVDAEVLTRVADQVARNDVDESLRRLLPTLYPHYISAGFKHPAVAHIRGLYGLARALGARVRESAADAASILADAGIPVLVLKGVPLAKEYYEDFGARPMSDADLMVPESVTIEQIRTLLEGTPGWVFEARADIRSATFRSPSNMSVDVHRFLLSHATFDGSTDALWADSHELVLRDGAAPVRSLSPEHQVFHGIVHGIPWNRVSPHRWIVDVGTVLRKSPDFDWNKVTELAVDYRLSATLATGIEWLSSQGLIESVEVPDADTRLDRVVQEYLARSSRGMLSSDKAMYWDIPRRLVKLRGERFTPNSYRNTLKQRLLLDDSVGVARPMVGGVIRQLRTAQRRRRGGVHLQR